MCSLLDAIRPQSCRPGLPLWSRPTLVRLRQTDCCAHLSKGIVEQRFANHHAWKTASTHPASTVVFRRAVRRRVRFPKSPAAHMASESTENPCVAHVPKALSTIKNPHAPNTSSHSAQHYPELSLIATVARTRDNPSNAAARSNVPLHRK